MLRVCSFYASKQCRPNSMSVSVICGNLHDSMVNQANKGLRRLFLCLKNWYRQMKFCSGFYCLCSSTCGTSLMVSKLTCLFVFLSHTHTHTYFWGEIKWWFTEFLFFVSLLWSGVRQKKIVKAATKLDKVLLSYPEYLSLPLWLLDSCLVNWFEPRQLFLE